MKCRQQCGACCIAPSINTPYWGMPNGKAAGERCVHLDAQTFSCAIWQTPHYPNTCKNFQPEPDFCGNNQQEALHLISVTEQLTG